MRSNAVAALMLTAACGAFGDAQAQQSSPVACTDLGSFAVVNTTITTAHMVAAGAFVRPVPAPFPGIEPDYSSLPAFCRVTGSIHPTSDSDIRFELWLPTDNEWNGRFMQTGNGGAAGSIVYNSLVEPLMRGYAVANTDTGHQGGGGDFSWAVGHPEKLVDYQYRAVHELTVVGKAITETHYGQAHEKAYWVGCSTGGRQGLKEAQRYPDDYDAIIAGAPASNWSPLMGLSIHIQRNLGSGGLAADKLSLLTEAAIAACDADDGVTDRVIARPDTCAFDPASLQCSAGGDGSQCLSHSEVAAARRIYAGVVDGDGELEFPGTGPGSERLWAAYASPGFRIGSNYFQNVVVNDPEWDPATFDIDRDIALAAEQDAGAADAMDPDLSAFVDGGGKLLVYHGTTDGLIPYRNSVEYHESVVAELGADAVEDHVKLYLVPGMDHCSGGAGAHRVDWLSALERWAEDGDTPGALPALHPGTSDGGPPGSAPTEPFTRVVCPYPQVARYDGSGDESDAANFRCVVP
jgi:feruloyl esterase